MTEVVAQSVVPIRGRHHRALWLLASRCGLDLEAGGTPHAPLAFVGVLLWRTLSPREDGEELHVLRVNWVFKVLKPTFLEILAPVVGQPSLSMLLRHVVSRGHVAVVTREVASVVADDATAGEGVLHRLGIVEVRPASVVLHPDRVLLISTRPHGKRLARFFEGRSERSAVFIVLIYLHWDCSLALASSGKS